MSEKFSASDVRMRLNWTNVGLKSIVSSFSFGAVSSFELD